MYRWKILLASKYNSDRQPEISTWPQNRKYISGTLTDSVEIPTPNSGFAMISFDDELDKRLAKLLRQPSTTKNWYIGAQSVYVAVSGCRSLSQSPKVSFFALGVVENPRFAVGIVILSVSSRDKYFRFCRRCRPHCHFRLSVIITITWRHGRKSRTSRWNSTPYVVVPVV